MGNGAANVLTGLGGNDTLDGGTGADTLTGGLGNDTYIVDNVGDIVTENAGEGTDTVQATLTYTLGANLENLTLLGTLAVNGTGNANNNTIIGNSAANSLTGLAGNDTLNGGGGIDTMIGGLGNDTYVVDNKLDVVTELAGEGTDTVQSSVTYALKVDIESLELTGTAAINGTGNASNNILIGNSGANILSGELGADSMTGGKGNDTYVVDSVGDVLNEIAGEGTDTVQSSIGFVLAGAFENLTLTGAGVINATGNDLANLLTGNNANNVLTGLQGNDTLNGGVGLDTMIGGIGNDTFVVDNVGDIVMENLGEGTDIVQSSVTHTLGATLENLTLTGTAAINGSGNNLINVLIGNSAANTLIGLDGNDTLNGGIGADGLIGGRGDDLYVVDNISDIITENVGEGTDAVQSSATFTLSANVDNLTLTGSAALNGTGNALNNVIIANSGVNHLYGLAGNDTLNGGNGGDFLDGGTGDDLYIVDNIADAITEAAGEGTDSVQSTITHTLIANVENLQLTGSSATTGTGNALNNTIVGNSGVNTLYGLDGNDWLDGGLGADKLYGGTGNDTYVVRNVAAVITENAGEGTDNVTSSTSYTLSANVENLTLAVGTNSWNATGNADANILTGNAGKNLLDGAAGADQMIGGDGYDTYVVDNAGDIVVENFNKGTDQVRSSVTYTLTSDVEYLTLTGTSAINGTGNELGNEITGNDAANTLMGGGGEDFIYGGAGDDILIGGALTDTLTGGLGNDTFRFTAVTDSGLDSLGMGPIDTIMDFTIGDHIDLSLIDANFGVAGDQAFILDVDASFSAGEISVANFGSVSYVTLNLDSNSAAEMAFYVQYTGSLTSADFIL